MGIDIYARYPEQDSDARQAQVDAWPSSDGHVGYIREAYHGEPYPSRHLMPEAFENADGVKIPAAVLQERLLETLRLAREREVKLYGARTDAEIEEQVMQYSDFVEFCETVEAETGQPPTIIASW